MADIRGATIADLKAALEKALSSIYEDHVSVVKNLTYNRVTRLVAALIKLEEEELAAQNASTRGARATSRRESLGGLHYFLKFLPKIDLPYGAERPDESLYFEKNLYERTPKADAITRDAEEFVKFVHSRFVEKNIAKLGSIIAARRKRSDGMALEKFDIMFLALRGDRLEGELVFHFQNGDGFMVRNSVIHNRRGDQYGNETHYLQFPTTFHDVVYMSRSVKVESENWMVHVFGRGETETEYQKRVEDGRVGEDVPRFSTEGSPLLPKLEAKAIIAEIRSRRKEVQKLVINAVKAKIKSRMVLSQDAALDLYDMWTSVNDTPKQDEVSESVRDGYFSSFSSLAVIADSESSYLPLADLTDELLKSKESLLKSSLFNSLRHALPTLSPLLFLRSPLVWEEAEAAARDVTEEILLSDLKAHFKDFYVPKYLRALATRELSSWPTPYRIDDSKIKLRPFLGALDKKIWPIFHSVVSSVAANDDLLLEMVVGRLEEHLLTFLSTDEVVNTGSEVTKVAITKFAKEKVEKEKEMLEQASASGGIEAALSILKEAGVQSHNLEDAFQAASAKDMEVALRKDRAQAAGGLDSYFELKKKLELIQ